jgi:hypothetical protein
LFLFYLMVGVDEAEPQLTCHTTANRRLAHAHEADEVKVRFRLFRFAQVKDSAE